MLHFLGLGAQKAGTTWLYAMLQHHPQIAFPAGKEQHFWDRHYHPQAVAQYFAQFQHPHQYEGEITPAYALLEPALIAQIHQYAPHVRLLFLIRNPIDRAWSAALMALERAQMTLDEASDQWFRDVFASQASLRRGDYLSTIRNWRAYFRQEQLLILQFDQLVQQPQELLVQVAQHLQLDARPFLDLPATQLHLKVFPGLGLTLRESLRSYLETLYRSKIQALEQELGMTTGW
jgi:hypothetical protein